MKLEHQWQASPSAETQIPGGFGASQRWTLLSPQTSLHLPKHTASHAASQRTPPPSPRMKAIGSGGEWWLNLPSLRRKHDSRRRNTDPRGRRRGPPREPLSSSSSESIGQNGGWPIDFPIRQAVTTACLTLTGDTIAQVRGRIIDRRNRAAESDRKVTPLSISILYLILSRFGSLGRASGSLSSR
jgi:hypothetical protein